MLQNVYDIRFWIVVWYMYGVVQCVTAQNTPSKGAKASYGAMPFRIATREVTYIYIYIS